MASRSTCMVLLAVLAFATYTAVSVSADPLLAHGSSSNNRKLAQYGRRYGNGYNNGYNDRGSAQLARNSIAITNTQYGIRRAVENGGVFPATARATYNGANQAYIATQQRYWRPYGRWWGKR